MTKREMAKICSKKKKNLLKQWSSRGRELSPRCYLCGKTDHLQCHHAFSKKFFPALRYDIANRIVVCPSCHTFKGKTELGSFHHSPLAVHKWIKDYYDDYVYCICNLHNEITYDIDTLNDIETCLITNTRYWDFITGE